MSSTPSKRPPTVDGGVTISKQLEWLQEGINKNIEEIGRVNLKLDAIKSVQGEQSKSYALLEKDVAHINSKIDEIKLTQVTEKDLNNISKDIIDRLHNMELTFTSQLKDFQSSFKEDLNKDIKELKAEIKSDKRWLIGILIAFAGVAVAVIFGLLRLLGSI